MFKRKKKEQGQQRIDSGLFGFNDTVKLVKIQNIVNKAIKEHKYKKAVEQISQLFLMEDLK